MIQRKKKICKGECGEMRYLFSKGMCKSCWAKLHKKPMKHISKSYASVLDEYRPKRKAFLENHPMCELKLKGCMKVIMPCVMLACKDEFKIKDQERPTKPLS